MVPPITKQRNVNYFIQRRFIKKKIYLKSGLSISKVPTQQTQNSG